MLHEGCEKMMITMKGIRRGEENYYNQEGGKKQVVIIRRKGNDNDFVKKGQ